ncbi:MAG: hypothetical protein AAGK66_01045, partial [Pseudomonadota bacterium]
GRFFALLFTITASIVAAWIYDNYVSDERRFEFLDKSPFSVAMRQCYSVPEGQARIMTLPTKSVNVRIPPELVQVQGFLSREVIIVRFESLNKLYKSGYISISDDVHLTEVRSRDTGEIIASIKAGGISSFEMDARDLDRVDLGFSVSGEPEDTLFSEGGLSPIESGKCALLNVIMLEED